MTVAELRVYLANYPGEATVQAVDGVEIVDVAFGGSGAEVLHKAAAVPGMQAADLERLEALLRISPADIYLCLSHYA
jgi:hypothetical protein